MKLPKGMNENIVAIVKVLDQLDNRLVEIANNTKELKEMYKEVKTFEQNNKREFGEFAPKPLITNDSEELEAEKNPLDETMSNR